ncbi:NAD(P)-binding protein [Cylindrobasidium torrendii FP15055 ss-10]|uniref:NAD(P)-binding protein n=1 Tax=Cylindrobasidium torrendii FP15055 ss-10 TaxID=1314674 RepID=A0A0D7BUW6_9AGAR|nr:NAD(P)-binding protein [Cylindrobasidium torrendii FP15055 ss-10]
MPAVAASSTTKVLVSGANGYIAVWVVRKLLEKGFAVRGTVRSDAKGAFLKEAFKSYGDKFELVIVPDITKDGAFDEAVKGVDAIEHTASPFHFNAKDPQELIEPAVKGTVGILASALKNGSAVKRIVVTSSVAAIVHNDPNPIVLDENDWNEQSPKEVEELGENATNTAKYRASKTLAEKAAWDFWNTHKSEVKWDLVCINPPFVLGPTIHEVSNAAALNTSARQFYDAIVKPDNGGTNLDSAGCWIDVRVLGDAHVAALEAESAGGERIIVNAGAFYWQQWLDVANALEPSPIPSHTLSKGTPGSWKGKTYPVVYKTAKEERILGLKKTTMEILARDTLADFEAKGW